MKYKLLYKANNYNNLFQNFVKLIILSKMNVIGTIFVEKIKVLKYI